MSTRAAAPVRLKPVRLEDEFVMLEPLGTEHIPGLQSAAADGELWQLWFASVPAPDATAAYVETALHGANEGHTAAFAVRERRSDRMVGSTRFFHFDAAVPRLEIGHTWYAASQQQSHVNPACKRLLLRHAFEVLECAAVEFRTDACNLRSQRAIERLGAHRDGVLRAHMRRPNGSLRDSVVYSILASEWPQVHGMLDARLQRLSESGS